MPLKQLSLFNKTPTKHGLTGSTVKYIQARTRNNRNGHFSKNTEEGRARRRMTARTIRMRRSYGKAGYYEIP